MKLKLKVLIILLLLNYTSLSQTDTNKICFDYLTVREISKDLIRYDSLKCEVEYLKDVININQTQLDLSNNSNVILSQKLQNSSGIIEAYKSRVIISDLRETEQINEIHRLTAKNATQKNALIATSTTASILGVILMVFIIK